MATEPAELLTVALGVAREAADLAVRMRSDGVTGIDTKSTITDVVTAADKAVEELVRSTLLQLRPGDAVLGEEAGGAVEPVPAGTVRWIVDPIDGTVNYLYGLPQYAVSLAAEVDGVVVAGVVRNPVTGQEWTAVRGEGAWRAGRRLSCSAQGELGLTLIATGFGYDARRRAHQAEVITRVLPRVRDIRRFGAASLDLCMTAEGMVDAYFEKGLAAWDRAAGGLIAEEAGLRVTGLRGSAPGPRFVLAANEAVYDELHDLLVSVDADGGP